jgi:hypothetical protein
MPACAIAVPVRAKNSSVIRITRFICPPQGCFGAARKNNLFYR